jgi:regulator of sigma E protease
MSYLIGTILLLGILVTIHEFGHFIVARMNGIKVLKFSIGFGPALYSRRAKSGTEFILAAIPLGGYVKFLDQRETDVDIPDELISQCYNQKKVWQRLLVVLAGPVANFILAIVVFAGLFMMGVSEPSSVLGKTSGLAQDAGLLSGDHIVELDGKEIETWSDVHFHLLNRIGESGKIEFSVIRNDLREKKIISINQWLSDAQDPDPLAELGLYTNIQYIIHSIVEGGSAAAAGLMQNDQIMSIDDLQVNNWSESAKLIQSSADKTLNIEILRDGQLYDYPVTPDNVDNIGHIGIQIGGQYTDIVIKHYGLIEAMSAGADKTWNMSVLILNFAKKMIIGQVPLDNIAGLGSISKAAGEALDSGWFQFVQLMAMLSITLGVMNLLPIPVLDGGHMVYLIIEGIIRKPVSEKIQLVLGQIGLMLLLTLMVFALFLDFGRIVN